MNLCRYFAWASVRAFGKLPAFNTDKEKRVISPKIKQSMPEISVSVKKSGVDKLVRTLNNVCYGGSNMENNKYLEEFKIDLVKQHLQGKQKKTSAKNTGLQNRRCGDGYASTQASYRNRGRSKA